MLDQVRQTIFNITTFGAVADGKTLCSKAFSAAVDAAVGAGGGTVYIPAGQYLTGPIVLKSNITLYVEAGAYIRFSQDIADYPLVKSRWEGVDRLVYSPQIFGEDAENIAVIGRGVFDGQGEYWWKAFREKKLDYPRPRFLSFNRSNNVLIEGIKIINSPAWTINPINCQNLTIDKITIKNPADSPNTDGINPESCKNVHISNCHVDVGDDCVTIKSGTEECSERIPCENITITNCTMVHGHGGVVIGSEMSGGVRNVVISNCVFEGTDRGIRFKSRRGRGGLVEDIRVTNVIMKNVIAPFVMGLYYFCGPGGKEESVWDKNPHPVNEQTPIFRRIHFSYITAREISASAGFLYGLPEMPIEDITFDNISVHLAKDAEPAVPSMMSFLDPMAGQGFFCCNVKNVTFNNVQVSGNTGVGFKIENSDNVAFSHCSMEALDPNQPVIQLTKVTRGLIQGCQVSPETPVFLELYGIEKEAVEVSGNRVRPEQIKITK
jgi:polygalacturonase